MAEKSFGVKEVNLIGASGTPSITSPNNINLNAVNVAISTNVSIGGTLTVSGSLSIGGTITYEDVTNVDSVGVVTARNGLNVSGGNVTIAKDIDVDGHTNLDNVNISGITTFANNVHAANVFTSYLSSTSGLVAPYADIDDYVDVGSNIKLGNAGVVTATSFSGSGANLTGIAVTEAPVVDYTITADGGSNYYFHGGGVDETDGNPDLYLIRGQKYRFNNTTGSGHPFRFTSTGNKNDTYSNGVTGDEDGVQFWTIPYDAPAKLFYVCTLHAGMVGNIYIRGAGGQNDNVGVTTFSGDVTLSSGNKLLIGTTDEGWTGYDELTIATSGNTGMTIRSGTSNTGAIAFADGTSGDAEYRGIIKYGHSDDDFFFCTNGDTTRMKVASDIIETGTKTITGGNNLAIQGFAVKGVYSGAPSIGKSIELISGYDSAVKMAAIGYNLTDVNLGGTYGGDLTFHTQPLYSSPTTPLPVRMRINSTGVITTPQQVGCAVRMSANISHPGNNSFNSGTSWVMPFDTEVWDIGSNFNTSNYTFTAPVAGRYLCCYTIQLETISSWVWNYVYPVVTGTGGNTNTVASAAAGVVFADDGGAGVTGGTNNTAAYRAFTNTLIMNLTKGQDVRLGIRGDMTATVKGTTETQWTMQLLG